MNILRERIRLERRGAPEAIYGRPAGYGWTGFPLFGARTAAGKVVTVDTALELVPVYAAVSLLAGAIGSVPLKVYSQSSDNVRREARGSRQWKLLHDQPNAEMAADEFWETIAACLLLWGNAFIYKKRDDSGVVQELWPIRPSRVAVGREEQQGESVRIFEIAGAGRAYETDILHIRGMGTDGQLGLSPIQMARQQLANDQAREEFQGSFWRNGMFAAGILTHPNRLSEEAQKRLAAQVRERSGTLRAGEALIFEEGMTWNNLTMPLEDAQFIQQAGFSDMRVAQLFGMIPPHRWGSESSKDRMTYANTEQAAADFVKWTGRRWWIRIEKSLQRDASMFPAPGPKLFPEFDLDALLRADATVRWENYKLGLDAGFISIPWVQQQENIDPESLGTPTPQQAAAQALDEQQDEPGTDMVPARSRVYDAEPAHRLHSVSLPAIELNPEIRVDIPQTEIRVQPAPVITNIDTSGVERAVDRLVAALGEIASKEMTVTVDAPVTVNVPETVVNLPELPVQLTLIDEDDDSEEMQIEFQRNQNGTIKGATITC